MKVKEYESKTLARVVKGILYDHDPASYDYAYLLLFEGAPPNTVVIYESLKTHVDFRIEEPHPDCRACHGEPQPVWYTSITARAFPDVLPEHYASVANIGAKNRRVLVPIIEPLEVYYGDVR